jgi:hypothetical protein
MPLRFEAAHGSAIDANNDLKIFQPRMQPTATPDEVEYQYPIYKGEKLHGIGCFGLCTLIEEEGEPTQLFTIDFGQDWVLKSIMQLKQRLEVDGDDFDFVHQLADGFVKVFQSRKHNPQAVHYLALSQDVCLREAGVRFPEELVRLSNGQIILAELRLPAHPVGGAAS